MAKNIHRGKIDDEQVIKAIRESDEPFMTAKEIGDELGVTRQALYGRLHRINTKDPNLQCKKAGRNRVWWYDE